MGGCGDRNSGVEQSPKNYSILDEINGHLS